MRNTNWLHLFLHAILILLLIAGALGAAHRDKDVPDGMSVQRDKCIYLLNVPADLDLPSAAPFDTTIVRSTVCPKHLLWFPPQGTETEYLLEMDSVKRDLHFGHDEFDKQWLDISNMPAGEYHVALLACGNGGGFTLRIQ